MSVAVFPSKDERWKAHRRSLVTASDVAAILGVDPRRGALSVYANKLGYDQEDNPDLVRGRRLEKFVLDTYSDATDRIVSRDPTITEEVSIDKDIPWLGATLDGLQWGSTKAPPPPGVPLPVGTSPGPVEAKTVRSELHHHWDGEDAPEHYQIQLQVQMRVRGLAWGSLVALLRHEDPPVVKDRLYDPGFIEMILPELDEFRLRVKDRKPPPADGFRATTQAVKRLWKPKPKKTVILPPEAVALVEKWQETKETSTGWKREVDRLENEIKVLLDGAECGSLLDGSYLYHQEQKRRQYTVEQTTFCKLSRWWPKHLRR